MNTITEMFLQMTPALLKVPTSPDEYRKGLLRLLIMNPTWTIFDLRDQLGMTNDQLIEAISRKE